MSERDEINKLPLGSAEDHVFAWSLGRLDEGIIVDNWKSQAMQMAVAMQGSDDEYVLKVVVLHVAGMVPNEPIGTVREQVILLPHDIARDIAKSIETQVEKIERNDRARIVANNDPPKEPEV